MNTLAIDIGGTKFSLALFEGNRMVERATQHTDRAGGPAWMIQQIGRIAKAWQPIHRCGVGFGGPLNFAEQRVVLSTHVGGWGGFQLREELLSLLRVPVIMDNDANVGALGEARYGAGRECPSVFYMTLSTGIGGGIYLDGKIWRGADSYAGELGHLTIRPDGPQCLCGARGCFERMCSGLWLERDHGRPAHELLRDPDFVRRYVVDLALGLKACIMVLNPARIVIGGGISKAGPALFEPLREELRRQITAWSRARIDVVPALFADDSVLYGALALAEELKTE
ncbi:MAG: ROK family protein [Acidobacteria bacterium]|nr:ROK family protein [Acidobacteriota bacterium]MBI3471291.1 ROK family protein [Candidatus Solibacter usitatus]